MAAWRRKESTMPIGTSIRRAYSWLDAILPSWMAREGVTLLRLSLGIVFFWFGALKFFPDLSPAQELATRTMGALTFGRVPPAVCLPVLAVWECLIGVGLLSGLFMRATLLLMFVQMVGTITPMFLFPDEVFLRFPYAPTLEGQYIIKNLVLISAGVVIGATVRGGKLIADPERVRSN
jgi:uncharacterized membrane protein YphA (DoxX/SURF4 family)